MLQIINGLWIGKELSAMELLTIESYQNYGFDYGVIAFHGPIVLGVLILGYSIIFFMFYRMLLFLWI